MADTGVVPDALPRGHLDTARPRLSSALSSVFDTKQPENARQGFVSGLQAVGLGLACGCSGLLVGPVTGAEREGAKGVAKGLAIGLVGAAALPLAGLSVGAMQMARGLATHKAALLQRYYGREWDEDTREWRPRTLQPDVPKEGPVAPQHWLCAALTRPRQQQPEQLHQQLQQPPQQPLHSAVAMTSADEADCPSYMFCPITQDIMEDPVVAADGFSYERAPIEAWLRKHATSPMTGARLKHKTLVPNNVLRSGITDWREQLLRRAKEAQTAAPKPSVHASGSEDKILVDCR